MTSESGFTYVLEFSDVLLLVLIVYAVIQVALRSFSRQKMKEA
jgi:hypothetical protein